MNNFVKYQTRFIAIQAPTIIFAQSRNFKGSFRVSFARKLPPTTALSLVSEVNAIFLRVSAVFSLHRTTRSACHRHYHTRCRRRRGLHVEEPIISDEENQSAFSPRLECLLLQSAIARRDMCLDIPLCFNQLRQKVWDCKPWTAIKW